MRQYIMKYTPFHLITLWHGVYSEIIPLLWYCHDLRFKIPPAMYIFDVIFVSVITVFNMPYAISNRYVLVLWHVRFTMPTLSRSRYSVICRHRCSGDHCNMWSAECAASIGHCYYSAVSYCAPFGSKNHCEAESVLYIPVCHSFEVVKMW